MKEEEKTYFIKYCPKCKKNGFTTKKDLKTGRTYAIKRDETELDKCPCGGDLTLTKEDIEKMSAPRKIIYSGHFTRDNSTFAMHGLVLKPRVIYSVTPRVFEWLVKVHKFIPVDREESGVIDFFDEQKFIAAKKAEVAEKAKKEKVKYVRGGE